MSADPEEQLLAPHGRGEFLVFLALCTHPVPVRGAPWDRAGQLQPHLSTTDDPRVGRWAVANNIELAYTPTNASWLNRIEAQFQAFRYFSLDGTDYSGHPSKRP
jgi:hypothetical protein